MWWHDKGTDRPVGSAQGSIMRAAAALVIAALAGGCFQPLYGEQSPTGGPVLRDQLSAVDILQIAAPKGTDEARIAVEIRNALLYDFTGGGYAAPPTHRLKISIAAGLLKRLPKSGDVWLEEQRKLSGRPIHSFDLHGAAVRSCHAKHSPQRLTAWLGM